MNHQNDISVIGVDLGGTKILSGKVCNAEMIEKFKVQVPKNGTEDEVLQAICNTIDNIIDNSVSGIGIGVPGIVDIDKGIVYDVQNIPSWEKVYLKDILEEKYQIPVIINNDANCFALGEKYFGEGRNYENYAALIIGTGVAAGIIIQNKIYNGSNCGAGEFGMIPYLDHHFEYYCRGQFFNNIHNANGEKVFQKASSGDPESLEMFQDYGTHLGNAINAILYSIDPEIIIMGGSVSKAYKFFKDSLWKSIGKLAYKSVVDRIKIVISSNPDIAVLGAAALYLDAFSLRMDDITEKAIQINN